MCVINAQVLVKSQLPKFTLQHILKTVRNIFHYHLFLDQLFRASIFQFTLRALTGLLPFHQSSVYSYAHYHTFFDEDEATNALLVIHDHHMKILPKTYMT